MFISLNFDYIFLNEQSQMDTLRKYLEEAMGFKYKVILNHRGLLCVRNNKIMKDDECWLNEWINREVEDLMIEYGVDMMFVAHEHQYMRFKPFQMMVPTQD